jgi:GntR family transcriptional regulator
MSDSYLLEFDQNSRDPSPLYLQLAKAIERAITEGRYRPEDALPSERVLAESLNLSRVTARSAIDKLVEQGLIIRRRGSGNYIAPRIEQPLVHLSSFTEELQKRGFKPSSRWLDRSVSLAMIDEQLTLGLASDERVARLERLRLADDVVMAHELSVLPVSILPDPMQVENSLYETLQKTNQVPVRALQHIRAMNAHPRLAEQLGIPEREAVLFVTRIGYLASGQVAELTHSYCRSDYYDFVVEMRRDR